jgi:hypothetical protein
MGRYLIRIYAQGGFSSHIGSIAATARIMLHSTQTNDQR